MSATALRLGEGKRKNVQMTESVPTGDDEGLLDAMVAIETNIAARGGMEYEHDQRWTRPARAREARGGEREGGIIRLAGTDRLAHSACWPDHATGWTERTCSTPTHEALASGSL